MESQAAETHGKKGDLICWPTTWKDVAQFFLLNYVLHAFSVVASPGSRTLFTILKTCIAMVMPFSGMVWAIGAISSFAVGTQNQLEKAARSGALCMVVPSDSFPECSPVSMVFQRVHGQHPVLVPSYHRVLGYLARICGGAKVLVNKDSEEALPKVSYKLVLVPLNFTVRPVLLERGGRYGIEISSNYSFLKGLAAIIQIVYGSLELYAARGTQILKFGYVAYSLTTIPYVVMSFINLIASLCRPDYPTLYMVYYRGKEDDLLQKSVGSTPAKKGEVVQQGPNITAGTDSHKELRPLIDMTDGTGEDEYPEDWMRKVEKDTSGAVGYAFGVPGQMNPDVRISGKIRLGCCVTLALLIVPTPYLIIYFLSGFHKGQSTTSQRSWITSSLVLGQACWGMLEALNAIVVLYHDRKAKLDVSKYAQLRGLRLLVGSASNVRLLIALYVSLVAVPILAGFIVVAQMMLQDEVCTKL